MKPLPLFQAATARARAKLRIAPHGQRTRHRKALRDALTAQLKTEVRT